MASPRAFSSTPPHTRFVGPLASTCRFYSLLRAHRSLAISFPSSPSLLLSVSRSAETDASLSPPAAQFSFTLAYLAAEISAFPPTSPSVVGRSGESASRAAAERAHREYRNRVGDTRSSVILRIPCALRASERKVRTGSRRASALVCDGAAGCCSCSSVVGSPFARTRARGVTGCARRLSTPYLDRASKRRLLARAR